MPAGENCTSSFLKVYDGLSDSAPLLLTACENKIPEPIKSTSTNLYVIFSTDGNENDHGFLGIKVNSIV